MLQSKYKIPTVGMNYGSGPTASTYLDFIQSRRGKVSSKVRDKELFETLDEKMIRIKDIIWQVSETNVPVLVTGEPGSGKDMIARAIHEASRGSEDKPFVVVNCASMTSSQLEVELFGVEKGAFSGAINKHIGKFEQAFSGTIVLDEITEIDQGLQAKLLRVLQEKEIERVGGKTTVPVKTRIIACTNKDILKAVQQGKFRQDLYYRLYVLHLEIPPLRERQKDIEILAKKFFEEAKIMNNRHDLTLAPDVLQKLKAHQWPGNVRELQNVIQRSTLIVEEDIIRPENISLHEDKGPLLFDWIPYLPIGQTLRTLETQFILETIKHHHGNRTHAARTLGISLRTLRNKINEFSAEGFEIMPPSFGRAEE